MKHKMLLFAGIAVIAIALGAVGVAAADQEGDAPQTHHIQLRHGRILEIGADYLFVDTRRGDLTVLVDEDTRFRILGADGPSLADLVVGDHVGFAGRMAGEGEMLARLVVRLPRREQVAHVRGELAAKGDSWLEVTRPDGVTIAVLVDTETRFRIADVEEPNLGDLAVGEEVVVDGHWNDDEQVEARLVTVVPQGVETVIRGEVTAVEEQAIELWTRAGAVSLYVDDGTRVFVPGIEEPTLADIAVGDRATAGGEVVSGGLEAAVIRVVPAEAHRGARRGIVTANDGTTLSLSTPRGDLLVTADEQTRFRIPGVDNPTLADVAAGYRAVVGGLYDPDNNTLLARIIGARPAPAGGEAPPDL